MGALEAGRHLRDLLTAPGPYRNRWKTQEKTVVPPDALSEAAVCEVLAQYLWDSGERSDRDVQLPRRLRDRVSRALNGSVLSPQTLHWFIAAFDLSVTDRARLEGLHEGTAKARSLSGDWAILAGQPPRRHRTLSTHEHHYLGADRLPETHQTTQVIEATEDGLGAS